MRHLRRIARIAAASAVAAAACAQLLPGTVSSFTASTSNSGNNVSAAPDWTPPAISGVVVQKTQGGATAKISQAGTFYLYAAVAETGNPPSGVASVTGDVSAIATVSNAAMTVGTYSVNGVSYGYRSAQLTAKPTLGNGTYAFSVRAVDTAGNDSGPSAGSATVDNTAFTGTDVTTADVAGNPGLAQATDRMAFLYNKAPEPGSILAGWTGAATSVPFRVADGTFYGLPSTQDIAAPVDAAGNPLGTGYAKLMGDFVTATKSVIFANSSMVLTGTTVTVTLGTPDLPGSVKADNANRLPTWTPSATAIDQFGHPAGTAVVTQSGVAKQQF